MSLTEPLNKIKPLLLPLNIALVATLAFGLGRWSKIEDSKTPVLIHNPSPAGDQGASIATAGEAGTLVGSKNGTKYHYPWCAGAQRIKEENKIWFASKEEATTKGYTPAANCPGLE